MAKKTIDKIDVRSKRVLMRVDFNVPLDENATPAPQKITDDRRIRLALPSIKSVIERGGRLILMSHLGRPEGKGFEPAFSLKPVADRLAELLKGPSAVGHQPSAGSARPTGDSAQPTASRVIFPSNDCIDAKSKAAVEALKDGEIIVLENLRFHKGEKKGDAAFAEKLAAYGDIYCNDAFGTAHRNDASMYAVPKIMKGAGKACVAGLLLQKELQFLSEAIAKAKKPFVAVLGGAKVSDKLGAIRNLMGKVNAILVGGAMAYTFLRTLGKRTGSSLVEEGMLGEARAILDAAGASHTDLVLPSDHVCARQISSQSPVQVFGENIDDGWMGLDIGPKTTADYTRRLGGAKTIVWNGPMGVFEVEPFHVGTREVAEAMAQATKKGAVTIVGGGDSAAAVEAFGLGDQFSHVSTGGGASLEMLEGKQFDSVSLLDEA